MEAGEKAKVVSKETASKMGEINQMLKFYGINDSVRICEKASNPYIVIRITLPAIEESSDSEIVELTIDFTDSDYSYKQSIEDLNKEAQKVLKRYRDELIFDIIYNDIKEQIMCKDFDAMMIEDNILITIKL